MSYFGIPLRNGLGLGLGTIPSLTSTPLSYRLAPSLNLQFAGAETLDPRITFTRTTTATFTGSNGLIQTAAIDAPRFDYNPVTLAPLGLLVEEQRVNLVLNSETLVTQVVTVAAVAHTLSFYGAGTVTISGTFIGSLVGTGAYPTRSTLTFTPIVGAITLTVSGSVTMAQLEAGAFATSYIPTVASQVTRTADFAVMTGTNFSSWFNQPQGTLYSESAPLVAPLPPTGRAVFHLRNTLPTPSQIDTRYRPSAKTGASVITVGVVQTNPSSTANYTTSSGKIALAYNTNDVAFTFNAEAVQTVTSVTIPTTLSIACIGNDLGAGHFNGTISRITYYPSRLSNAELQAITR